MAHQIENNEVPFTQYLRPDGRKQSIEITLDDEAAKKAQELLDLGFYFEAEVLINGMCSFTIGGYDPRIEEQSDLAIKLCPNGPAVRAAVRQMIMNFNPNEVKADE